MSQDDSNTPKKKWETPQVVQVQPGYVTLFREKPPHAPEVGDAVDVELPGGDIKVRCTWLGKVGGTVSLTEAMKLMCDIQAERESEG